jgi:hypothetical protein
LFSIQPKVNKIAADEFSPNHFGTLSYQSAGHDKTHLLVAPASTHAERQVAVRAVNVETHLQSGSWGTPFSISDDRGMVMDNRTCQYTALSGIMQCHLQYRR